MLKHLRSAEEWRVKVEAMEMEALRKAKAQGAGQRRRKDGYELDSSYIASRILDDNFFYRKALNNFNFHRDQAQLYGIAVLADRIPNV